MLVCSKGWRKSLPAAPFMLVCFDPSGWSRHTQLLCLPGQPSLACICEHITEGHASADLLLLLSVGSKADELQGSCLLSCHSDKADSVPPALLDVLFSNKCPGYLLISI